MLICPVCGAETENTALVRLGMQIDKEDSRELIVKYKMELDEINRRIERANKKSEELRSQIEEIETLVSTKKEEYTLKEYLDNKVIEKLHELFNENEMEFEENIQRVEGDIHDEEEKPLYFSIRISSAVSLPSLAIFTSCSSVRIRRFSIFISASETVSNVLSDFSVF